MYTMKEKTKAYVRLQLKATQFIIDNINTKRLNKIENMKGIVSMSVGKSCTLYNEGLD